MNATVCPINPPGHDWEAGLACRWCDATRTPGEAVLSGLASVRGWSREAARAVRDAHRAEVLAEGELLPKEDVVAWLVKKAREGTPIELLASKVARGAIRPDNLRMLPADFFEPGRTYTRTGRSGLRLRFVCEHLTTDPKVGDREAWGWVLRSNGTRRREFLFDHDFPLWTPEAGEGRG